MAGVDHVAIAAAASSTATRVIVIARRAAGREEYVLSSELWAIVSWPRSSVRVAIRVALPWLILVSVWALGASDVVRWCSCGLPSSLRRGVCSSPASCRPRS